MLGCRSGGGGKRIDAGRAACTSPANCASFACIASGDGRSAAPWTPTDAWNCASSPSIFASACSISTCRASADHRSLSAASAAASSASSASAFSSAARARSASRSSDARSSAPASASDDGLSKLDCDVVDSRRFFGMLRAVSSRAVSWRAVSSRRASSRLCRLVSSAAALESARPPFSAIDASSCCSCLSELVDMRPARAAAAAAAAAAASSGTAPDPSPAPAPS